MEQIIQRLVEQRGFFRNFERGKKDVDITKELSVVSEIGKAIEPKFKILPINRFFYENMILWANGNDFKCLNPISSKEIISGRLNKGFFIGGYTGSGKSLALDITAAYCQYLGVTTTVDGDSMDMIWRNYRASQICNYYEKEGALEEFIDMPIIGLQDVGTDNTESVYMGTRKNVIRTIIEQRGDERNKMTFITSNYPLYYKSIKEMYGDRVLSRLVDMCNYYEITGVDFRIQNLK